MSDLPFEDEGPQRSPFPQDDEDHDFNNDPQDYIEQPWDDPEEEDSDIDPDYEDDDE
jgi:hypothetical protein